MKPWTCARVEIKVLPSDRKGKGRLKELKAMKDIASEGIKKTPYVQVEWSSGEKAAALLDTGAQWSLICLSKLT